MLLGCGWPGSPTSTSTFCPPSGSRPSGPRWPAPTRTPPDWLPWFTCHAVGEVLRELAAAYPERQIVVLCGHTHDRCRVRIADNLEVRTGAVDYGAPRVEEVLEVA